MTKLAFIFLCDGPTEASSWRPNDDKSQWWARRDALSRICCASLWQARGTANAACRETHLLFNDDGQQTDEYPVVTLRSNAAANYHIPVATEHALIKNFRKAFQSAAQRSNKKTLINTKKDVIVASFTAHLDAGEYGSRDKKISSSSSNSISASIGEAHSTQEIDTDKCDKRELLRFLQR